jgi:altronate hydrolase
LNEKSSSKIFPNVDGLKFLKHTGGCGGAGSDSEALCALLAGYITHPNVAGATVLSLGCQKAQIDMLKREIEKRSPGDDRSVYFLEQQAMASEQAMMMSAIGKTLEGLAVANTCRREPAPLSELTVGTECGGSDGFSGISANPLVGLMSDRLAALGGTPVLSEFPELCGVEQNLVNRCKSEALADKFKSIIGTYSDKADAEGEGFHNNPSPGNIKDGLITDAIKSAGAALKGGSSPVCDVLDYTEPFTKRGLNLLCTPGNDVESTTALAGSGANLILFTTGLGTPTGNPVCPVIKISSNSKIAHSLSDLIDFNAGSIIEGTKSLESLADELMELVIAVASGQSTKAMLLNQDDFIPWKRGLSL